MGKVFQAEAILDDPSDTMRLLGRPRLCTAVALCTWSLGGVGDAGGVGELGGAR